MAPPAPPTAAEHKRLAQAALQAGFGAAALEHMRQACALEPGSAPLRCEYGCLLAASGLNADALAAFNESVALQPGLAEGWHFLGLTLLRLGRTAEALAPLRRARALAPGHLRTLELLAQAEFDAGDPADALPLWRELHALRPGDEAVLLKLGETLSRLDDAGAACMLYRDALARSPGSAGLWMALAQAEEIAGRRDEAEAAYDRALALRPGWAFPLSGVLGLRRGQASEARVAEARALLAGGRLADADQAMLGYELGKVFDGRGEHAAALAAWDAANAARRREAGEPDVAALERRVEATLAVFDRALLARAGELGDPDERPVFVVGMPRSGTTLLEQIIGAHPLAFGAGELPDVALIARGLPARRGNAGQWPHILEDIAPEWLLPSARRYLAAASRHAPPGTRRIVDKYPMNYYLLGFIGLMFPNARFIWCRRDPRDIAVSIYGENFALAERLATSMAGIGHLVRLQERLMHHWQAVLPQPILEFHYETLAREPEAQARRALGFCGLDWDPACLEFHQGERSVQTPSRWQVRQPVHTRSIGRWRHYAAAMPPLLQALGYDPDAA